MYSIVQLQLLYKANTMMCVQLQIVAVGPEVSSEYAIGKRVCVENHFYCGHCYQCTHGKD